MYLAYVVGTYPQPSETFIAREVEGMRARGHRVAVFSLFAPAGGVMDGVTYGWATETARAWRKLGGTAAVRRLAATWRREFAAQGVEAVVAHFGSLPSTVALEAAGELPFFLSLHARDIYVEAERLEEKLARATATVTCTRANLDYLRTQYPAHADRMHLVYHGLPADWLDDAPPARTRAEDEPLRLLAVGRLVEKKGFAVLLDACTRLRRQGVAFTLRIVGDGPEATTLGAQCRRLALDDAVTFTGWASPEAVHDAYQWADVFCCPSIIARDGDRDGLPNVLLEAMARGLPAVGTRLSGIPEAITDGDTGLLVPPGDPDTLAAALIRLHNPALRTRLSRNAVAHIRTHFNGERWLDVLEEKFQAARDITPNS